MGGTCLMLEVGVSEQEGVLSRYSVGSPLGVPSFLLCNCRLIRSGCGSTARNTPCTGSSIPTTSSSSLPSPRWVAGAAHGVGCPVSSLAPSGD